MSCAKFFAVLSVVGLSLFGPRPGGATTPNVSPAAPVVCTEWTSFGPASGFPTRRVYALLTVGEVVWAGTDFGIAHGGARGWRRLGEGDGLPSDEVWDLALAPNGDVWAATAAGLARVTGGRVDVFRARDSGLPSDVVYAVAARGADVWAATAGGVARFRPGTGSWESWDSGQHGLPLGGALALEIAQGRPLVAPASGGLLALGADAERWDPWPSGAAADSRGQGAIVALAAVGPADAPEETRPVVWGGGAWGLARFGEATAEPAAQAGSVAPHGLYGHQGALYASGPLGLTVFAGGRAFRYRAGPEGGGTLALPGRTQTGASALPLRSAAVGGPVGAATVAAGALWVATVDGLGWCQPSEADQRVATELLAAPGPAATPPAPPVAAPGAARGPIAPPRTARRGRRVGVLATASSSSSLGWLPGLRAALELNEPGAGRSPVEVRVRAPLREWPGMQAGVAARLLFGARVALLVAPVEGLALAELLPLLERAQTPLLIVGASPVVQGPGAEWVVAAPSVDATPEEPSAAGPEESERLHGRPPLASEAPGVALGSWIRRVLGPGAPAAGGDALLLRLQTTPAVPTPATPPGASPRSGMPRR